MNYFPDSPLFRFLFFGFLVLWFPCFSTAQTTEVTRDNANQLIDSLCRKCLNLYQPQPAEALSCIDSTIGLMIAVAGKTHPAYSRGIETKATMLTDSRKFAEAEGLLQEAMLVLRSIPDTNTTQFARLLYSYARLKKFEDIPQALAYYDRSQRLFEQLNAITHSAYSSIFDDLAFIYYNAGQYESAATALSKSKEIQEAQQKTNNPGYLVTLVNLGALNYALNQRDDALSYFEQAARQYEAQNQTAQTNYAVVLNNLGYMYTEKGDYEKSKQTYFRSKALLENAQKQSTPEYAQLLLNIGSTHYMLKEYDQAEAAFWESKSTYEKAGHDKAILYFRAWRNIGVIKNALEQYSEAIPVFESVLKGWSEAVGELDNFYLETVNWLVEAHYKTGNFTAASNLIESCTALEKRLLNRAGAYFSQSEMMEYLPSISLSEHWFGPLLKIQGLEQHSLCEAYYDAQLFRKGYFLQSSLITQNLIATAPEATRQRFEAWKKCQEKLSELYAIPVAERLLNADSLELAGIALEKELLQSLPGFAEARQEIRWQDVMHALPPGSAAVEFIDFTDYSTSEKLERVYAALVLVHNATTPRFVSLCKTSDLEKLTRRSKSWLSDYTDKLYSYKQSTGLSSLYQLIWERMEEALQGASTIYYSPSGLLHHINPEAIQLKDGSRLADHFTFVKTGNTRQLAIRDDNRPKQLAKTAAVFGGIQYDPDNKVSQNANPGQTQINITSGSRGFGFNEADSTLRRNYWKYLEASYSEAQKINRQLTDAGYTTNLKTGWFATEDALKQLPPLRVLHIATHGFFFPDPEQQVNDKPEQPVFILNKNPMMRSGILLAGANHTWQTGRPIRPDMEDGILTAYEISLMNLAGTELVVLSACETGLGDLSGNEGVYGLQRAFKIASAKYLLMSLWKVPDAQTETLMSLFYQKWLDEQLEIHEAFRAAQAAVRTKHPNPYFWAGFVLQE